jgi:hypothetical protein
MPAAVRFIADVHAEPAALALYGEREAGPDPDGLPIRIHQGVRNAT